MTDEQELELSVSITTEFDDVFVDAMYPRIAQAVYGSCWMITPEQMDTITSILQARMRGERLTAGMIDERIVAV